MTRDVQAMGVDIPGPIDWEHASHWVEYDHFNETVETWCKTGPERHVMRTRVRPMSDGEIIWSRTREFTREQILECFGIVEEPAPPAVPRKRRWFGFY